VETALDGACIDEVVLEECGDGRFTERFAGAPLRIALTVRLSSGPQDVLSTSTRPNPLPPSNCRSDDGVQPSQCTAQEASCDPWR
jgi:hypothetical protein